MSAERQHGTAARLEDLAGPQCGGGADMIVNLNTGKIVRIWKQAAKFESIERTGRSYRVVAGPQRCWLANVVEDPANHGRNEDYYALTRVYWNETGWYRVMSTSTDENGFIVATPSGKELQPS